MYKTFSAFLAAAALATVAQAFTITGVSARQRWPWNNFIDIDFNIGGAAAGDTFKIDVRLRMRTAARHWSRSVSSRIPS